MRKQWPPSTVAGGDAGGAGQFSIPHDSEYHSARSRETEQSKARRKAQCADLRGTGSATRCSRRRTRVATHAARRSSRPCREWNNWALETTPSTHTACEGEGRASGSGWHRTTRSEHVGQHVDVETTQALDKPRHHTAKDGVYGARGARLTHSQTATPESEYASRLGKHVQMDDPDEKKPKERTYSW